MFQKSSTSNRRASTGVILAALVLAPIVSLACRFNVRDVGFVDLGSKPYQLFCFVDKSTPADLVSQIEDISIAALLDSNIQAEVVNVDSAAGHPAQSLDR